MKRILTISMATLVVGACAAQEVATLPEIDVSATPGKVVVLPDETPDVLRQHFVKYTNPYFAPVEHEVVVEAGDTVHDRATLSEPIAVTDDTEAAP